MRLSSSHQGIGMTSQRTRDRLVARLQEQGISSPEILSQIAQTPRHMFVDEALAHRAYEDTALPIGLNQTISQPFVVALMTQLLLVNKPQKVLEIGTGCGYQAAILAGLCEQVWTIERIAELSSKAVRRWRELRIRNVRSRVGDGYNGWSDQAPFDAIIVTAAAPQVPEGLVQQLTPNGRMVIPVGDDCQDLWVIERNQDEVIKTVHEPVNFVPMLPGILRSNGR